jgi:predicted dehydrogenase
VTRFRWGIFGTGSVSAKFAAGLKQLGDADVAMVASRGQVQADSFAAAFGAPNAIAGYEAAASAAPGLVDAVYIATPPALHREHALACVRAGVPVLIEKPFALDADAAQTIVAAAREANVFCMEAMWTRFMPALTRLKTLIEDGAIGEPRMIAGSFGISNAVDPAYGNFDPARGGGALAHLGLYPISLGQWLFGTPVDVHGAGRVGDTRVEEDAAIALRYASGVVGSFHASLRAPAANDLAIHGTHGSLTLAGPLYRPWGIERRSASPRSQPKAGLSRKALFKEGDLYQRLVRMRERLQGQGKTIALPFAGNGYHYEAAEVAACIRAGQSESAIMPLGDSLAVAATLDALRAQIKAGGAA